MPVRDHTEAVSLTALALVLAAALYAGFQWTIRVVVYPQFCEVGATEFPAFEAMHQRRVTVAVGPLFAALVASTAAVLIDPPARASGWLLAVIGMLLLVVLNATGGFAVALHRQLGGGFDAGVHRRLLAVDSVRLGAAVLDVVAAVVLIAR